jgi:hypothetical protein
MILEKALIKTTVIAIVKSSERTEKYSCCNLITDDGDLHMAELLAGQTPTNTFNTCVLGTGSVAAAKTDTYDDVTPILGSEKAASSGYPRTNDTDPYNSGAGADICTYKFEWSESDFNNSAIREGCITVTSPTTGSKLFNRWVWSASFEKASDATMTLYVNIEITGS